MDTPSKEIFYELEPATYTMRKRFKERSSDRNELIFRHGHIAITNYRMGDNREFEKSLSVFDEMNWKYELKGGYYVKPLKEFRINRGYNLQSLMNFFPAYTARVENDPYPSDKVQMDLLVPPRDDFQKVALTFMCSQGAYKSNNNFTQQMIEAKVGFGKCQPDDTMIPTPTGMRRLDSLKVGDIIYDHYHNEQSILNIYPQTGLLSTYKITLANGSSTRCGYDHLWQVMTLDSIITLVPFYVLYTDFINNGKSRYRIPVYEDGIINYVQIWNVTMCEDTTQRCILVSSNDHLYITEDNIITHNTYCGVATACFLQARVVIIVPIGKLLDQWKQSFLDFTNIKPEEILIVQGSATCKKILDGKYTDIKVFIFSADTIVSFHDQYGDLETIELLRATNAYMKIIDEVHRDMKAIAMIEALSNFRMNYYMSASPDRSDKKESWIFKTCFKNVPKFGKDLKLKSDDHLNVIIKNYSFVPNQVQIKRMVNARTKWLNNKLYEAELFNAPDNQKADFIKSLKAMLAWAKKNLKGSNKIMILGQTVDGTEFLQNIAEEFFPNETARYWGSLKPAEKEEALKKRVICATSSSLGTGADIKGIQFVINTGTYANKIDAIQISGRARRIEGIEVFYIELVNIGYRKTYKQYENRKQYLVQASKTGKLIVID